ncbi:copper amine oxidase N-terminal domain-containing protein, partial [Acetivibrio saccincola]|uniref:copper amine oxidase N-terminal domain-containing protein n=1 Tax=Acetivibrio saccincola TaxID=1677857 RepID=UPI0016958549
MAFTTTSFAQLPLRVVVNGNRVNFPDAEPFIDDNGRTQVPVRFVSEALGAEVSWEGSTKTVTISQRDKEIKIVIGKKDYTINGEKSLMDTEALLKEDRTFVPIRFVSEGLGARVDWDPAVRTVYIDTREKGDIKDDTPKDGGFEEVNGFLVPKDTNIIVVNSSSDIIETSISINILRPNFEQQIGDLVFVIESRFGKDIANEIEKHVRQKKSRWTYLPEKYIYVKETNQYIWISRSEAGDIPIDIMVPGYVPDTSQYDDIVVEWGN